MMTILVYLFDQSVCIRLTETLLHVFWQGLAIGLLTTIAAWLCRHGSARVRYGIHAAGLVLTAACVPITFVLVASPHVPPAEIVFSGTSDVDQSPIVEPAVSTITQSDVMPGANRHGSTPIAELSIAQRDNTRIEAVRSLPKSSNETATTNAWFKRFRVGFAINRFAPYAALGYFVGLLLMIARLTCALWGGHRLRQCATSVSDPLLLKRIRAQAALIGIRLVPVVAYCERITIPVVAGIIRPVILLPLWLATEMDPDQVLVILAHEMAHIRRFDLIVNLLQRLLETALFFHPAVWWISHQLSAERENCCDDMVVQAGYAPLQYASTLVRMAELCTANRRPIPKTMLALAATGTNGGQLKRRIVRLIGGTQQLRLTRGDSLMLMLVAGMFVATTAGVWRHATAAPPEKSTQSSNADAGEKPDAQAEKSAVQPDQTKTVAYHGRVVDEEGKPIAGAELWYVLPTRMSTPSGEILGSGSIHKVTATDSDGNFSFSVEPPNWTGPKYAVESRCLTAKAPGYGCDWLPLAAFETNPVASEFSDRIREMTDRGLGAGRFASQTLKLPREVGPVLGRLVDLDGRPLADVEICVQYVQRINMDLLKKAFETSSPELAEQAIRAFSSPGNLSNDDWQVLIPRPKTNQNGEFTLSGLGRNQLATVTLYHERVDAESLRIVGAEMEPQQVARSSRRGGGHKEIYLGTRFTHAAGPAIPVSGVVTEFQSGKPVANTRVSVERLFQVRNSDAQLRFARHINTVTDDQGGYKLVGIPPGKGHFIQVTPEKTEPLFPMKQEFSVESAEANATINVQLVRGIWIEGKVTDAQTGEPISGVVDYFPFQKNPIAVIHKGLGYSMEMHRFVVDEAGHYRVPGLPGPGVVMISSQRKRAYPLAAGADKIEGYDAKQKRLPSVMVPTPLSNWNQISFVNPPDDATSYELDVTLSAGASLRGNVVGPDGAPALDVEVYGQVPMDSFFQKLKDDSFTITDYSAKHPRDLFFLARNGSLVGYLHLDGAPPEELKVHLQPAVIVRGKLVDTETDEPAAQYHLHCESSKRGEFRIDKAYTDDQGRFEVNGLLAGNVYKMDAANRQHFISRKNGFTIDLSNAKPGDVIDLGDVTGKHARKEK